MYIRILCTCTRSSCKRVGLYYVLFFLHRFPVDFLRIGPFNIRGTNHDVVMRKDIIVSIRRVRAIVTLPTNGIWMLANSRSVLLHIPIIIIIIII